MKPKLASPIPLVFRKNRLSIPAEPLVSEIRRPWAKNRRNFLRSAEAVENVCHDYNLDVPDARENLVGLILKRLDRDLDALQADFACTDRGVTARYAVIDDLLPAEWAERIAAAFPDSREMRLLDSFREKKYTSKSLDRFDALIRDVTFAFQDERVIAKVAEITGLRDAIGDPHLYAGGLSSMERGHFLNPHIDNSHDGEQQNYRVLNLLYYVTPEWKADNGGSLELWDDHVTRPLEIPSLFNRLVLMSTGDKTWHSVNEVRVDTPRRCVSNYYFSPHSPNGSETSHVTYFMARPEQKLRRVITKVDSELRSMLRRIKRRGFAQRDIYERGGE